MAHANSSNKLGMNEQLSKMRFAQVRWNISTPNVQIFGSDIIINSQHVLFRVLRDQTGCTVDQAQLVEYE
jgi:hypothetical protein